MGDTIAGIATAMGEGGVAIVRVSGPDAEKLLERVFEPRKAKPPFESHRLMTGWLTDGKRRLDEIMAVLMRAPSTYTREDVCELHTHGGHIAAQEALRLLLSFGARAAEAGEFTRRAFMNGRIDLAQAEAVMGVIAARGEAAFRAQEAQLAGGQSAFVKTAQAELVSLLSGLEAHIDYPDEIDESEALTGLNGGLEQLIAHLDSAIDEKSARLLREGVRVALFGSPNAGKSTLFNALLREERAIVTDVPGTTRDVLRGSLTLDGMTVHLLDTAGLRESGDEVERIGVQRARQAISLADAALLLLDAGRPLSSEERALLQAPPVSPCAVLLNKGDLPAVLHPAQLEALTSCRPVLSISAKTGQGLELVEDFLRAQARVPTEMLLTHTRHIEVTKQALARLRQAREALAGGMPLDLAAVDLHEALYLLGKITGESVDEKLLDDIFSRFCVGK